MVRKILADIPEEQIKENLERYRQKAIELATDAKTITSDQNLLILESLMDLGALYGCNP